MNGFAEKLTRLRGDRSIAQVARETDITPSSMSMYERGERVPRDDVKVKLAEYYGTTVGSLFYDEK